MKVVVKVKSYYDWVPVAEDEKVPEGVLVTADQMGKRIKRVHIKKPSETTISIPDEQVDSTFDNFESDPVPFMRLTKVMTPSHLRDYPPTRVGVLAWHIGEKVMPMHAPVEDWGKISMDKDKTIEKELNRIFANVKETSK